MKKIHPHITNLKQKIFNPKQRVTLSILVFLFVGIGISFTYDYFAKGATYGWLQSSWSGNADTLSTANHTNNQNNWNKFFSKNDNISADSEITLNSTNLIKTDTTTANFQTGTNTNGTYPILNTNNELKLDIPTCNTTTADAGADQTGAPTCGLTTVTLNGNAPTVGTGSWTKVSGTGGTFANANLRNTTFTGTAGLTYVLRWTISNGTCPASTDDVTITFNRNPTVANAGVDQNICGIFGTYSTMTANSPSIGSGSWSLISGTATIATPNSETSSVTGLVTGSSATLRWTISNSPCNNSFDDIVIMILQPAVCPSNVVDIDGNSYNVISSCSNQCWMKENLKTTKNASGVSITRYCYNNNISNCSVYGGLYTWTSMMNGESASNNSPSGRQGICPTGWHIPSDEEWNQYEYNLEIFTPPFGSTTLNYFRTIIGSRGNVGLKIKASSSHTPAWDGVNSSLFSGLPGGYRDYTSPFSYGVLGTQGNFWTASESGSSGIRRNFSSSSIGSSRIVTSKGAGFSVRCIKD